jgi:hypothetical protein
MLNKELNQTIKTNLKMKKAHILILPLLLAASFSVQAAINVDTCIYISGVRHPLAISIPSDYNPSKSYPLIVGLHYCGDGGNSENYRKGLMPLCDSLNVIIACPDNNSEQIKNTGFITASIDTAKHLYNINAGEVFLTGFSCNGLTTLQMGLNSIYPFKGIFPWNPWYYTPFTSTTFNLGSKIPTVISVGSLDDNYGSTLNLYDSLVSHGAKVDLVIVQGIDHSMAFAQFSNEMIRCMNYLNDTNSITIDQVDDFEMFNNDPAKELKVKIVHKTGKAMNFRALSHYPGYLPNPKVEIIPGTDTVIVKITPKASRIGTFRVILEAAEEGGAAIEQTVFLVKIKAPPVAINETNSNQDFDVYPIPASNFVFIKSMEKNLSIQIIDINGKTVFSKNNFDTSSSIDVSDLAKGFYIVRATNTNLNKIVRLIKE